MIKYRARERETDTLHCLSSDCVGEAMDVSDALERGEIGAKPRHMPAYSSLVGHATLVRNFVSGYYTVRG